MYAIRSYYVLDGDEIPERGIDRVVLRRIAGVGESIGQHPFADEAGKSAQNAGGGGVATRGERETGQRDHRVAPPVAEPGIAGDDGLAERLPAGVTPLDDELIGCERELPDPGGILGQSGASEQLVVSGTLASVSFRITSYNVCYTKLLR